MGSHIWHVLSQERKLIFLVLVNLRHSVASGRKTIVGVVDAQRAIVTAVDHCVVTNDFVTAVAKVDVVPLALDLELVNPRSREFVAKHSRLTIPESDINLIETTRFVGCLTVDE